MSSKSAVLDTSAYSHIERGNSELLRLLKSYDRLLMPLNTLAELKSGFRLGTKEGKNLSTLKQFLDRPEVGIVQADERTLGHYVILDVIARQKHRILSHNDLWIAACAEQSSYDLVTFDKDFIVFSAIFGRRLAILDTR
ncbi:MAG TPA: PIN domain-containing protein [Candidatus Limnocylindria bacterium]|nr:PIN domain-containing protein [Candidatus Limnocylindria bacterium]